MEDVLQEGRGDKEKKKNELQKVERQGKVPGIVLKGLVLAVAVGVMPFLHKHSLTPHLMVPYANHATIARSWELFNLLLIALAVSYGLISRRHTPTDTDKDTHTHTHTHTDMDREQGAQNYVQKMFDFAEVFDNLEKMEAWSSRWQPQEPVVVIDKEKPLLLPIRSLKSSLSNPEAFDFLKDADADAAVEDSGKRAEVRNTTILSVESGNFEEEVSSNVIVDEVFPSPVPWASRLHKETPHPHPPAIPSPIPWRSRPDRTVLPDQKSVAENGGGVSDSKPPLPPPQRAPPPPPPPQMPNNRSPLPSPSLTLASTDARSQKNTQLPSANGPSQKSQSPSPSPSPSPSRSPSPSPSPSPRVELINDINLQASPDILLPNLPSHAARSSQNNPSPKPQYSNEAEGKNSAKDHPSLPTVAENGSSVKHHSNGNSSIPKSPVPPPPILQEFPEPNERSGNITRGKGRECSSRRRSKMRETPSVSRSKMRENPSDSRSKMRETPSDSRSKMRGTSSDSSRRVASPVPPPLYPDESAPLPPPPPYSDDELSYENTSSSSEVLYHMDDSFSETEEEVDKKADQFIAKFHEQIRLQRVESMRRHERKADQ